MTKLSMAAIEAAYAYMSNPDTPWRLPYEANDEGVSPAAYDASTMNDELAREANLDAIESVLRVAAAAAPMSSLDVVLSGLALRLTRDASLSPAEVETTEMFVERAIARLIETNRSQNTEIHRLRDLIDGDRLLLAQAKDQSERRLGGLRRARRIERFAQEAFDSLGELHNWLSQALTPRYAPLNDEGIDLARKAVGRAQTLIVRAVANDPFAPASDAPATPWGDLPDVLGKLLGELPNVAAPLITCSIGDLFPLPADASPASDISMDVEVAAKQIGIPTDELRGVTEEIRSGRLTRASLINGVPYGDLKCITRNPDGSGSDCGLCVYVERELDRIEQEHAAAGDASA